MDVSDGIASDLKHILKSSGKGAEINLDSLPLSEKLKQFCSDNNLDATELATSGGEDYCLLLTIDKSHFTNITENFRQEFNKDIFPLGRITGESGITYTLNGNKIEYLKGGFNHFS